MTLYSEALLANSATLTSHMLAELDITPHLGLCPLLYINRMCRLKFLQILNEQGM